MLNKYNNWEIWGEIRRDPAESNSEFGNSETSRFLRSRNPSPPFCPKFVAAHALSVGEIQFRDRIWNEFRFAVFVVYSTNSTVLNLNLDSEIRSSSCFRNRFFRDFGLRVWDLRLRWWRARIAEFITRGKSYSSASCTHSITCFRYFIFNLKPLTLKIFQPFSDCLRLIIVKSWNLLFAV